MSISLLDKNPQLDMKSTPLRKCLEKNYDSLWEWAKESKTDCFRLYDRDLPDYPFAIDVYAGRFCVHYFSPTKGEDEPSSELADEVEKALLTLFKTSPQAIYWRTRMRSKKTRQYEKAGEIKEFFTATEYGVKFKINLIDYLDTGLFLDHRETRQMVASLAKGKQVLNLFAYTCSFSVHAAVAGAALTKSVDLSNTYTDWGKENLKLNALPLKNNIVVRADCLKFLGEEMRAGRKYDIIIIDPPTISRSKKMTQLFDVQKDYPFLISKALQLLLPKGVIFFSTNSRKFKFDEAQFKECKIIEVTDKTIPLDFRDKKIHRCWQIFKD